MKRGKSSLSPEDRKSFLEGAIERALPENKITYEWLAANMPFEVTLQTIPRWLKDLPDIAKRIAAHNKRQNELVRESRRRADLQRLRRLRHPQTQ